VPEPDAVYIALGTGGTAAGAAIGLAAAGIMAEVVAVRVTDPIVSSGPVLHTLVRRTVRRLQRVDNRFPEVTKIALDNLRIDAGELGPGYGAVWEAGEEHEASSDEGLTAVVVEGAFSVEALRRTMEIVVADYDPEWPAWFAAVCDQVWPTVAELAVRIDHVGSTSVPGLAAKPIIDMDIVVASSDRIEPVIERLATIGYRWRGDLGVVGREAFERRPDRSPELPPHHLYLVVEDNRAHLDHWLLRDLLRADPEAREQYAAIKRHSAATADNDLEAYGVTKSALITDLLARARADRADRAGSTG